VLFRAVFLCNDLPLWACQTGEFNSILTAEVQLASEAMGSPPNVGPRGVDLSAAKRKKKAAAPNSLFEDEKPLGVGTIAPAVNALNELTLDSLKALQQAPHPSEQLRRTVQTVVGLLHREDMEEWPAPPSWEQAAKSVAKTGDFFKRLHSYPYPRLEGRQERLAGVLPDLTLHPSTLQEESSAGGTLLLWAQLVLG